MTLQFFDGRESLPFGLSPGPFGWAVQAALTRARAAWRHFLHGLHEARRQQAAIELARHRLLIFDSATGLTFRFNPPRGTPAHDPLGRFKQKEG